MSIGLLNVTVASQVIHGATVKGVSARGIAYLMARFPELRMYMLGRAVTLDAGKIIALAPQAVAAIIACACGIVPDGSEGSDTRQIEAEREAGDLPLDTQVDLIEAAIRLTMPGGVGPFVAKWEKLADFAAGAFGREADTNSPQQSEQAVPPAT